MISCQRVLRPGISACMAWPARQARTAWSGGGAHFLAIIGYRLRNDMLAVDDPWYGKSDVAYATFNSSYQGSGSWTHSYFTRA